MHEIGTQVRWTKDEYDRIFTLKAITEKGKRGKEAHLEDKLGNMEVVPFSQVATPRTKAAPRKRAYKLGDEETAVISRFDHVEATVHPAKRAVSKLLDSGIDPNQLHALDALVTSRDAEKKRSAAAHQQAAIMFTNVLLKYLKDTEPKPRSFWDRVRDVFFSDEAEANEQDLIVNHLSRAIEYHLNEADLA